MLLTSFRICDVPQFLATYLIELELMLCNFFLVAKFSIPLPLYDVYDYFKM